MTGNTRAPSVLSHAVDTPSILTVPGLHGSGPIHWQTLWEQRLAFCTRVPLPDVDDPRPESWIAALDMSISKAAGDVILVAHSLGSIAVVEWAAFAFPDLLQKISGALLVAPCDVEHGVRYPVLRRFAPILREPLPFPSILVASSNDLCAELARSYEFSQSWGSDFINVGAQGHINAESGLGHWPFGLALLDKLMDGRNASPLAQHRSNQARLTATLDDMPAVAALWLGEDAKVLSHGSPREIDLELVDVVVEEPGQADWAKARQLARWLERAPKASRRSMVEGLMPPCSSSWMR